jgi:regulator of RNase E activity RraA
LAGVLGLQGVVVEVIVRPWNQLLERGFPVTGKAERFDIADLLGGDRPADQGR